MRHSSRIHVRILRPVTTSRKRTTQQLALRLLMIEHLGSHLATAIRLALHARRWPLQTSPEADPRPMAGAVRSAAQPESNAFETRSVVFQKGPLEYDGRGRVLAITKTLTSDHKKPAHPRALMPTGIGNHILCRFNSIFRRACMHSSSLTMSATAPRTPN